MEMRKTVLYGVLAFCLVVLNSCLGDPATQLTMANQAGVVVTGYGPGKAIYTKGDVVVSSEDFQNANVENGECILFDSDRAEVEAINIIVSQQFIRIIGQRETVHLVCRVIAYLREQEQIASDISGTRLEGRKQQFVLCNNRGIGQRIIEVPTINLRDRIFINNSLGITGIRPCPHIVCDPVIDGIIKQNTFSVSSIKRGR